MSKTKHTPGSWNFRNFIISAKTATIQVASTECPSRFSPSKEEMQANGRLIAAAPDLLVALQNIRGKFYRALVISGTTDEFATIACAEADAALARAIA